MVFNPMPEFFANSLEQLNQKTTNIYDQETVTRMIAEAVKAEREACAKVCEPQEAHDDPLTAWKIAQAIRARGEA